MNSKRKKLLTTLVVAGVMATVLGVAIGTAAQDDKRGTGSSDGSKVTLDPDLAAKFSTLTTAKSSDDAIPEALASGLSGQISEDLVLNPDLARKTGSYSAGRASYLVPGDGGLCLALVTGGVDRAAGLACSMTFQIDSGAMGPASLLGGCEVAGPGKPPTCTSTSVYGVAPDGVAEVTVQQQDGSTKSMKVENNAYLFDLDAEPRSLSWIGSDGQTERSFPLAGE